MPVFQIFLFLVLGLGFAQAQTTNNQIVPFRKVGQKVEFSQPQGSISFSLQSQVRSGAPWTNLKTTPANASSPIVSLPIPPEVRNRNLRVVAKVASPIGQRKPMSFALARDGKSLNFKTTQHARLYSVERYQVSKKRWYRVSTVAASSTEGISVRVNLPPNLGKISAPCLRVIAVFGDAPASPDFSSSVSPKLLSGVSKFSPQIVEGTAQLAPVFSADAKLADGGVDVAVEEADLWKIRGRKIYLFNQLRGLQVLDVTDASNPEVAGYWPLPAQGEDLYLLGGNEKGANEALLLARLPWQSDRPEGTRILRVGLINDSPELRTSLDLPGALQESRLVGDRLHIVSTSWQDEEGNWSPKTWVITLNVSQPGILVEESRRSIPRYVSAIGSTEKYIWLAGSESGDWSRHTLTAYPILTGGVLGQPMVAKLGGIIQDKFKVGEIKGGVAAVVQTWTAPDGSWQNRTLVETYGTGANGVMNRRAQLQVIQNEWLFATRFDGDRLYAVTFQQTDPLWLLDLGDPDKPAITGHLEVPGWSSFIEPMGNLLVAVGREGGQLQVSLFDVSDRKNPKLSSRMNVGESGYSWSEAEWNEKAVRILPQAGLVLVPMTEWSGGKASHGVRILGLNRSGKTLAALGTIRHEFSPRRSTLLDGDLVASVSNRELLLVDVQNRSAPVVKAKATLAFGVDRLALYSGCLYQFENGNSWFGGPSTAVMRVAQTGDPDGAVAQIPLTAANVSAAEVIGDRLVVVEGGHSYPWGLWMRRGWASDSSETTSVSVWSLKNPSLPALLGRVPLSASLGAEVTILPASSGIVAVARKGGGFSNNIWCGGGVVALADARVASCGLYPSGYGSASLAVDLVRVAGTPTVLGSWSVTDPNIDSISSVYANGDLLTFGFQKREIVPVVKNVQPTQFRDPATGLISISLPSIELANPSWQSRNWFQVLDLADPTLPTPWAPVEIPGSLLGVSWLERGGGVLFTQSGADDNRVYALGFDGENASVAAEVDVGANRALISKVGSVYAAGDASVRRWDFIENQGVFGSPISWSVPSPGASQLKIVGGDPLVFVNNTVHLLKQSGFISLKDLPGSLDLGLVRYDGVNLAAPTGLYGTFLAHP
jgi:hypothetical protein